MHKTFSFTLSFLISLFVFAGFSFGQQAGKPGVVVVELFTSQGDINSVEADQLLTEIKADALKNNKAVYCLSEHVDFWNRLGWTDPFSSIKYTRRLQNYSSVLNEKETYTPKFIINGKSAGTRPDKAEIKKFIANELKTPALVELDFNYQVFADTLELSYKIDEAVSKSKNGSNWYMSIAVVDNQQQTKVTAGDNKGKILINSNVVKILHTTNLTTSEGLTKIALNGIKSGTGKSIIAFVQIKKTKQIIGATQKEFN